MLVSPFSVSDLKRLPLEKVLFRQPTMFIGGYTVAAMEFVDRSGDNDTIGEPLFDSIHSLFDKSLLPNCPLSKMRRKTSNGSACWKLYVTMLLHLAAVGEFGMSRERHSIYFLGTVGSEGQADAPGYIRSTRSDLDHANFDDSLEYRRDALV